MSEVEEIAKAVRETARFCEKGLDVAEKASSFFAKVFKEPANEIAGMITDKLRYARWVRLVDMSDKVNDILAQRGVKDIRAVTPKLALPIMGEASLEDDASIQELWQRLLANAMDPSFNDEIRYGYIEMLKSITGIEAKMLNIFYESLQKKGHLYPLAQVYEYMVKKEELCRVVGMSEDEYSIAANNLMRLQLIAPGVLKVMALSFGEGEPSTVFKGIDAITLTPLGIKFIEACMK